MLKRFEKSEKGQVTSIIFLVVLLLVFGIIALFMIPILKTVNDTVQGSTVFSQDVKDRTDKNVNRYAAMMDSAFALILALGFLGIIIGAFLIDTHPAFFVISLILVVAVMGVIPVLANLYGNFADNPSLSTYASEFKYIPFIFQNYLLIGGVMSAVMLLSLYAKSKVQA